MTPARLARFIPVLFVLALVCAVPAAAQDATPSSPGGETGHTFVYHEVTAFAQGIVAEIRHVAIRPAVAQPSRVQASMNQSGSIGDEIVEFHQARIERRQTGGEARHPGTARERALGGGDLLGTPDGSAHRTAAGSLF